MRQIVLDTETTGLEPQQGHRIIEIGCVELINRRASGRTFHKYLNPQRDIDEGALAVHGISRADLEDKPTFAQVAEELLGFIGGAELVIHNAAFDVAFLDWELGMIPGESRTIAALCSVLDTLALARSMHPGQRNNLDALCKRYNVDNSRRELHGALLDARILADVYLAMTGGQGALELTDNAAARGTGQGGRTVRALVRPSIPLRIVTATDEELAAHAAMLAVIAKASGGRCLWPAQSGQAEPEQTRSSA
ncbi:MAG TPA: DNA polymerase III subunit epsilon [Steroidobacteraceae bacterium]|nr:DNA polymerase III subunit epsilon [Steroidobacteraceae bacterium]